MLHHLPQAGLPDIQIGVSFKWLAAIFGSASRLIFLLLGNPPMPYPLKSAPLRRADQGESSHPNRHAGTNFLLWRRSPATALSSKPSFPDGEIGPCPSRCATPVLPQLGHAGPHNRPPHRRWPRPPRLGKRWHALLISVFLLPQNAALDTARMDHHAEVCLNSFSQCHPTRDGSAARCWSIKSSTSGVSLRAPRGPRFCGTKPAKPPCWKSICA